MNDSERLPAQNPFSTRRVRPGAIPFFFPDGVELETLVDRLRENQWRGEIVGPHGSGKSALLAALVPAIEQASRRVELVALHDGQRRLPHTIDKKPGPDASTVLVIDGFEQLSTRRRSRIRRLCADRGAGLVATSHASVGLPTLFHTATDRDLARRVVAWLLGNERPRIVSEQVDAAFARHGGDLRETLFALYDLYESLRKGGQS